MPEKEQERQKRDQEDRAAEGYRSETRDRALVSLDEKEVKARMLEAFERLLDLQMEVHLIGVRTAREAITYKLLLAEDGADHIELRKIQAVADDLRLDVIWERDSGLNMYARW